MNHAQHQADDWLPQVKGELRFDVSLAPMTWLGVGGVADILFRPLDEEDLSTFLRAKALDVPVTLIGAASNLLIRDGGIPGVVIRLGAGFQEIERVDDGLKVGCGVMGHVLAQMACEEGLSGLEFLSGIPGTLGGAIRMNAGAHGREVKDILSQLTGIDLKGNRHVLDNRDCGFAYRHSQIPAELIISSAVLQGIPGNKEEIRAKIAAYKEYREQSQPQKVRTGGSTFKNPPGHKAWELIDKAGCRGLKIGQAQISPKHCNFMLNLGGASAHELESLGEEVRKRVKANSGIELEWEIQRLGRPKNA